MKVLLIEDNPTNRGYLVDAMRKEGFYVLHASDAVQALELLRKTEKPDLLITDLVLPGMSGQSLLKKPEVKGLHIMVITASVDPDSLPPDVEFLAKPFSLREFITRVRRFRDWYQTHSQGVGS